MEGVRELSRVAGCGSILASVAEPSPQSFNWGKERANLLRDSNARTSYKAPTPVRLTWQGTMRAAWYEKQGAARDVLTIGEMDDSQPLAGEVRIRVAFSGVNPGDVKKRKDAFGVGMPYLRVIPHSAIHGSSFGESSAAG